MIVAERCYTVGFINQIFRHPAIYPHLTDDFSPSDPAQFNVAELVENPHIYFVMPYETEPFVIPHSMGCFMFTPHNAVLYEVHSAILPAFRGKRALEAAAKVRQWLFDNTPCQKLITHVPEYNRLALRFAKQSGLVVEGINRKSFQKNGVLMDQILLGITKDESCQLQQQ